MEINQQPVFQEKQSSGINFEEEYILTLEEELTVIENMINLLKKNKAWKMGQIGMHEGTILEKIASIDWDKEIDKESILKTANSNKHAAVWQKEMIEKIKDEEREKFSQVKERCTAAFFFQLMDHNCNKIYRKPFQFDNDNRKLIDTICFFLSRDKHFETSLNLDSEKGLMIRGTVGLGKTFLFELVKNNPLNPIKIISMIEIAEAVKQDGFYNIDLKDEKIIYLDDVGTEEATVNHFGTKISWFKDFIEKYYTRKGLFKNLVISSNLSAQQIEDNYGSRVRSRSREMFNLIDISGRDRRK